MSLTFFTIRTAHGTRSIPPRPSARPVPKARCGAQALLSASASLGVTPRILGVPGLDNQAVTTALVSIAQDLRAFVYSYAHDCTTISDVTAYRDQFGARELMIIWPEFEAFDVTAAETTTISAVACALGLRAKLDQQIGWHKTLSNVAVNGVTGISADVFWSLQNPNTDAGILNAADVTTLIQRDGFRFWGSRTCAGPTSPFAFENYTRTAQILADTIAEAHMWAVDKPLHASLARDIIEGINAKFGELKGLGLIVDGNAWLNEDLNDQTSLKAGKLPHRLRLHAGTAAGRSRLPAAHHRYLSGRLRRARERRLRRH
ncbi:phage tail sheath subtilisin-like domain-containing protein [Larsenimonas rhizosphaerae]